MERRREGWRGPKTKCSGGKEYNGINICYSMNRARNSTYVRMYVHGTIGLKKMFIYVVHRDSILRTYVGAH